MCTLIVRFWRQAGVPIVLGRRFPVVAGDPGACCGVIWPVMTDVPSGRACRLWPRIGTREHCRVVRFLGTSVFALARTPVRGRLHWMHR
jgi:hypothetical protein